MFGARGRRRGEARALELWIELWIEMWIEMWIESGACEFDACEFDSCMVQAPVQARDSGHEERGRHVRRNKFGRRSESIRDR